MDQTQKIGLLLFYLALTALIFFALLALMGLGAQGEERENAALVQAVQEGILQCYALEGAYPPDLAYLEDHYGLAFNHEHYYYHYEAYGANIFPIIKVIKK